MSESLPRSLRPIWLGNLPHDPEKLREVEHHLAIAIAKICEEMGEKVDAEDLRFRFHTKGASFNGKGLGFGFAWIPPATAEELVRRGKVACTTCVASVRESRGTPTPPVATPCSEEISVVMAATFGADDFFANVLDSLSAWRRLFEKAKITIDLRFSEKHELQDLGQMLQQPRSLLRRFPVTVVLWRPADLLNCSSSSVEFLLEAVSSSSGENALIFLQIKESETEEEHHATAAFRSGLRDVDLCEVLDWSELVKLYPCATCDPAAAACAMTLRRCTAAQLSKKVKVFVSDCDYTLWNGSISDDGLYGLNISAPHMELQKKLSDLQEAGRLICLASRNASPDDVLQVFVERPCALKLEQIVAWEVHLGSKAESLQRLSEKLNISLDSFVFLDDNSFEVEDVSRSLPDVLVIHVPGNLGNEDAFRRSLQHCWVLDVFTGKVVTKEDQQRTQLYQQNAARRLERSRHSNLEDFLKSLQVEIAIRQPSTDDKARLSQLLARTNQFNTTQFRLSEHEVESWCVNDLRHVLAAEVKDKYGEYGLVGSVFCSFDDTAMVVDCLAMSCRVLHRGVEQQLLRMVAEVAVAKGKEQIQVKFRPSSKNDLARGFLARVAYFCTDITDHGECGSYTGYTSYTMECGKQNFTFSTQRLLHLESSQLLQDFSETCMTDTFTKDALRREQKVLSWTNVVDAEEWMGVPLTQPVEPASWSQLLMSVSAMGPEVPRSKNLLRFDEILLTFDVF